VLRRALVVLSLDACGGTSEDATPAAAGAVTTFTPPSPRGCSNAGAYDYCFAFDRATPLAIRVELAAETPDGAVGNVRFHTEAGTPAAVLNDVSFGLPAAKAALAFYFQVYPATYTVDVDVAGAHATTSPVEIGDAPVATSVVLP